MAEHRPHRAQHQSAALDAGADLDTVLRCLGLLADRGFIERCDHGWRLRRG